MRSIVLKDPTPFSDVRPIGHSSDRNLMPKRRTTFDKRFNSACPWAARSLRKPFAREPDCDAILENAESQWRRVWKQEFQSQGSRTSDFEEAMKWKNSQQALEKT